MLIGQLGRDSETRIAGNTEKTTFSIATENSYKDKEGKWISNTTWHNILAWKLSDYFKQALIKGAKVYVEGRLEKREYTDKDGNKRLQVEVVADKIISLSESKNKTSNPDLGQNVDETIEDKDDLPF